MFESLRFFIELTWKEFVEWVYANNDSIPLYVGKVILAGFFISLLVMR